MVLVCVCDCLFRSSKWMFWSTYVHRPRFFFSWIGRRGRRRCELELRCWGCPGAWASSSRAALTRARIRERGAYAYLVFFSILFWLFFFYTQFWERVARGIFFFVIGDFWFEKWNSDTRVVLFFSLLHKSIVYFIFFCFCISLIFSSINLMIIK